MRTSPAKDPLPSTRRLCAALQILSAAALVAGSSVSIAHAASFQGLGVLPLPSSQLQSAAAGVSFDGAAVVGTVETDDDPVAFLWTSDAGAMAAVEFLDPTLPANIGAAVSANGELVVGRAESGSGRQAYSRSNAGAVLGLGDLSGGQFASAATGVSASGDVVVGSGHSAFGAEAFRFDHPSGPVIGLGFLPNGISSEAHGVSPDGGTIVGSSATFSAIAGEAFRWTSTGGMVGLGDLPGGQAKSVAYGASTAGGVIVGNGTSAAGTEAFRWTAGGGMQSLGDLPGGATSSAARAVSATGAVIVGEGHTAAANSAAFIWDATNGMRDLQTVLASEFGLSSELAGWDLLSATGVSGDGRVIAGTGINASGDFEAWRAELGDVTPVSGGIIATPVVLGFGDVLRGFGIVQQVVAAPGAIISAVDGNLTVGEPAGPIPVYYDIHTGGFSVIVDSSSATIHDDGTIAGGDPITAAPGTLLANGSLNVQGSVRGHIFQYAQSDMVFAGSSSGVEIAGNSLTQPVRLAAGGVIDMTEWQGTMRNVAFGCPTCRGSQQAAVVQLNVVGGQGPGVKRMGDIVFESTSTLEIDVAGTTPGVDFGQLDHFLDGGTATLGGTIDLDFVDGFLPVGGESFEILKTAGGVIGTFDREILPVVGDLVVQLVYLPHSVVVEVNIPGDFNKDGKVAGDDFLGWQRGSSPDSLSAADLADWQQNFGAGAAATGSLQSVSEPSTALATLVALTLVGWVRPTGSGGAAQRCVR